MKAPTTLLLGSPGSGKTTALISYIEAGLELFVLVTDPGGEEALLDAAIERKVDISKLHWHYVPAMGMTWEEAKTGISMVNTLSYKALGDLKSGIQKPKHRQLLDVIDALGDFQCERTGKSYGPVNEFDHTKAIAIDSMTGINKMAKRLVVGGKPNLHQGEWGTAMEVEEMFLDLLIGNTKCFVCCTAHLEKEFDEVQGKQVLMASFLGRRLAPKIPSSFSDVVLTIRTGDKFRWSTAALDVDLKSRTLPLSDEIPPSFKQVVEGWHKRNTVLGLLAKEEEEEKEEENN